MSQGSDISELLHTLSDGTMDQLRSELGDVNHYIDPEMLNSNSGQELFQNASRSSTSEGVMSNDLSEFPVHPSFDQSFHNVLHQEQQNLNAAGQQQVILPRPPQSPQLLPTFYQITLPAMSLLHSRDNIPGEFEFDIGFEPERLPLVKATSWTFSTKLNRIYAKNKVEIPIRLKLKEGFLAQHYQNLFVRIFVMFSKTEHIRDIVQRCPNHLQDGRKHIIECSNSEALYGFEASGGHYFVGFPLRCPDVGQQHILEYLKFSCLNTCPGGPDRRQFHCVFLLEYQGHVVGKRILDTKISTTPGRDKPKDEASSLKRKSPLRLKVKQEVHVPADQVAAQPPVQGPLVQEQQAVVKDEDDDEIYTIQVRGFRHFQEVLHFKEAIELRDLVPPALLENYRASCPPCGPTRFLEQQRQQLTTTQAGPPTMGSLPSTCTSTNPPRNARYTMKRQIKKEQVVEKRNEVIS